VRSLKTNEVVLNAFNKGNRSDGKHYWLSPESLWKTVQGLLGVKKIKIYDPCPYPKPDEYDGLAAAAEWGEFNYVNPPFGSILSASGKKIGMTAWVRKAIQEQQKGKTTVLVFPQHGWVHMLVNAGAEFVSLGPVRWIATEDGEQAKKGNSSPIMAFVLRGK
jgi:hypothetical protein